MDLILVVVVVLNIVFVLGDGTYNRELFLTSQVRSGKVYNSKIRQSNLDANENNCMFYNSKRSITRRYTRCPKTVPCVIVQIFTFYNDTPTMYDQRLGCGLNYSAKYNCAGSKCSFADFGKMANSTSEKYKMCCCYGNLCNSVKQLQHDSPVLPGTTAIPKGTSTMVLTTIISSVTFLLIVICLCIVYLWRKIEKRNRTNQHNSLRLPTVISMTKTLSEETLDHILRGNLLHQGCHSAVRLGTIQGKPVAVKVFPPRSRMQWSNEKEIYGILGSHPNIAKFIASEQVSQDFGFEGIIVMSHYTEGSLLNFLRTHTLPWKQMIRFAYCISNGLAYLHGEEKNDRSCQISIAHRDLNSRNVLVKSDGTCVIADFGFALRLTGKFLNGKFPVVGSPRYMAPEVLDGSIIMSDWSLAFKQVDCYGLGLLLWELCRRCNEIIEPNLSVPECLLPYEEELGSGPSIKKVRYFVCEQQMRPKFPTSWRKDTFTLSYLKQTIVECWDPDGDARLTPSCVLNRLKQMEDFTRTENNIYKETLSQDVEIFCGDLDYSEENMFEKDVCTCSYAANKEDYIGACSSEHHMMEINNVRCESFQSNGSFVMLPNVITDMSETRLLSEES